MEIKKKVAPDKRNAKTPRRGLCGTTLRSRQGFAENVFVMWRSGVAN